MAGAERFVDVKVSGKKVVLFAKRGFPSCYIVRKTLSEFNMKPEDYEVLEIETRQDVSQIETYLRTVCLTDTRAVPQLFVGGKYIGGEKEITHLHASGELKKLLEAAGAV